MSVATIRAAIGTALATIASINSVNNQVPDSIGKLPCTVASCERIRYHTTLDGTKTQEWRILLLLAERDSKAAHDDLDPYLEVSGGDSVKYTLENADIGDDRSVSIAENVGHISYRNKTFIGAEFILEVVETP